MNDKRFTKFVCLVTLFLSACAPSQPAIRTAIEKNASRMDAGPYTDWVSI
jgi:hypothetical protein